VDSARLAMITKAVQPRPVQILPRGDWLDRSGPVVQPAVPEFLGTISVPDGRRASRLDLASWLTDPRRGAGLLTARVFVNRFWYILFGRGLSESLDDFGGQGTPPTHPELLDRLSHYFVESGWDVKATLKLLAMSEAYRRSSQTAESGERRSLAESCFAVQSRSRLSAEMIRDSALAISGLLVRKIGGPSVKPYQPSGYYRHLNFPTRKYVHDTDDRQWRRGLYVHWQRQFLHPMMKAFDAPRREECTAQRATSNTPLAALTLLNDPTFVEAARAFAARILRTGGSTDDDRLTSAFRLAVSRPPDSFESRILMKLLAENRVLFSASMESAQQVVSTGQAPVDRKHPPAELAAWTVVARAILNLNETNTRN